MDANIRNKFDDTSDNIPIYNPSGSSGKKYFPDNLSSTHCNYLKLDDAEIFYEVTGEGPAIIFVHGLGGNHLSWWQQIPFFADRYKCVNFSHRGFALSKNFSNRIGHKVFAEDLNALIDYLNLDEVYLVAQSMGGWTSLTYALNHPNKIKALVMASTSGTIDFTKTKSFDFEKYASWNKWAELEKKKLKEKGILNAIGDKLAEKNPFLAFYYEQIYNLTPYSYKEFIRTDIKNNRNLSPDVLKKVDIPVLFITGENDMLFPTIGGKTLASELKNAKYFNSNNSGHSVYFENPAEFNKTVDKFISNYSEIKAKSS